MTHLADQDQNATPKHTSAVSCRTFAGATLDSCRKLVAAMNNVKRAHLQQTGTAQNRNANAVRWALNEAEALAWQTSFPHLVFPLLAEEKVVEARAWMNRQKWIQR